MSEAFLSDALRNPIGRLNGALSAVHADDLAALPLRDCGSASKAGPRLVMLERFPTSLHCILSL